jgi:hypothetical protein
MRDLTPLFTLQSQTGVQSDQRSPRFALLQNEVNPSIVIWIVTLRELEILNRNPKTIEDDRQAAERFHVEHLRLEREQL